MSLDRVCNTRNNPDLADPGFFILRFHPAQYDICVIQRNSSNKFRYTLPQFRSSFFNSFLVMLADSDLQCIPPWFAISHSSPSIIQQVVYCQYKKSLKIRLTTNINKGQQIFNKCLHIDNFNAKN